MLPQLPEKVSQESYHCGTCVWILGWWACSSCCFHEVCIQKQFVSCETTILKCLVFKQPRITPNRKSCCELLLFIITIIQITCHKQTKTGDWLFYHTSNTKQTTTNQIPFQQKGNSPMSLSFHIFLPSKKETHSLCSCSFHLTLSHNSINK